jgi:S-methylmethionine-dependent homocysteine/selenocysteine methylase
VARYRGALPQVGADIFLTDGGIGTSLLFDEGLALPRFAVFTLLATVRGRDALGRYYDRYARIGVRDGVGVVLGTPTWRANPDWGRRLGYSPRALARANRRAVRQLIDVRGRHETTSSPVVISGTVGPRGDGYDARNPMTVAEATCYHAFQARVLASSDADLLTATTMTYPAEAIGIVEAARRTRMPVAVSFTVETDGTLPSGHSLREAIECVDEATGSYPAYFMINCAHPDHFAGVLEAGAGWTLRVRGLRANSSRRSHAELDQQTELDAGDSGELAALYQRLRAVYPHLVVLGGCCGTNHRHIDAISTACANVIHDSVGSE